MKIPSTFRRPSLILALVATIAFLVRLFAVLRFEAIVHEFDPWFSYRSSLYLIQHGFINFLNWFDSESWYPLGRIVGFTVYPGLMWTTALIYKILHFFHIFLEVRHVAVFLAPLFASFTVIVAYLLTKEISEDKRAGLIAAALISVVPGYISRSVAGSYDNECVSIFALLLAFYLWNRALKLGSMWYGVLAALGYFYMAAAWGAYTYISNLVAIHVLVLLVFGFYSHRLYVSYTTLYLLGMLLSMQIRFIGFLPVRSSEHLLAFMAFLALQGFGIFKFTRSLLSRDQFRKLLKTLGMILVFLSVIAIIISHFTGYLAPWTGRFYALLDPTYAKNHIPIIASVSEHQPTTWGSYFFDLHLLVIFAPFGVWALFRKDLTPQAVFIILYFVTSVYFTGVMVRLMLILAPVMCVLSGIGISHLLAPHVENLRSKGVRKSSEVKKDQKSEKKAKKGKIVKGISGIPTSISLTTIVSICILLVFYARHCVWVTSSAYSSPSVVLAARGGDGSRVIFDDFREVYSWINHNTKPNAKIMSWWDYGYQISGMANRTVLVDNNTWNTSHIATVGRAMALPEEKAIKTLRELDVDYILVLFGGMSGFASDDINKFLWMVRIGSNEFGDIKESDYLTERGEYKIDKEAPPAMLNSLLYKMCYYRFGEVQFDYRQPSGFDRVRNAEIGNKDISFDYIEEAFTSSHWLMRAYRVKKETEL
ncbi:hypothetical protein P9112_007075 [Eukaryota sp. TZLM1-RC]